MQAVELRTTHKHGVEPELNEDAAEGSAEAVRRARRSCAWDSAATSGSTIPIRPSFSKAIERSKEFIRLSHDIGGSGVKVKPDKFHKDVPREKTIEQIGKSLNELGEYAAGFGQQVRLEVHGECAELPTIKAIMDIATDDNVAVCWNSNVTDLKGDGLEKNFKLVRKRFGANAARPRSHGQGLSLARAGELAREDRLRRLRAAGSRQQANRLRGRDGRAGQSLRAVVEKAKARGIRRRWLPAYPAAAKLRRMQSVTAATSISFATSMFLRAAIGRPPVENRRARRQLARASPRPPASPTISNSSGLVRATTATASWM